MGQYYMPILGDKFGSNCKVFDRSVDGEYTLAKLMEHSWWLNPFVNSFSSKLFKHKKRVIWCGDYATEFGDFNLDSSVYIPNYYEIWGETVKLYAVKSSDFTLDNKFLLNHNTKQFIDLNEYKANSIDSSGWCIHPLPLLTAVGNGLGFGDFHENGIGFEHVGIWAWHLLSISNSVPRNFKKFNLTFKEMLG